MKFLIQLAMPPGALAVGVVLGLALALAAVGLKRLGWLVAFLGIQEAVVLSMRLVTDGPDWRAPPQARPWRDD